METTPLLSYAKVNFGLRVLRKRPDGFHEIQTVLQTVDLCDTLNVSLIQNEEIQVLCDHPEVPSGEQNLVHEAAQLLQREFRVRQGCRIEIVKRIPPGAGLAGGSGNAAATLVSLGRLWDLNLSKGKLLTLAARLGSDVPFFLEGGTALAEGRGEKLTSLRMVPDFWLVIIKPDFSIATRWAYGHVKIPLTSNSLLVKLKDLKEIVNLEQLLSFLDNDLERAVAEVHPAIGELKRELLSKGALGAAMSGSGSAVFGLVKTKKAAEKLAKKMSRAGRQLFVVRPVRRCKTLR
ncbi:4-(cytidine 5'-diphospho)-2-C-methyl-D-erythritol kinase [bacterium]|nr:4-(cytidine 5'-diphospho)-2-C-methyl-D-erythritol kinase [bacterium]